MVPEKMKKLTLDAGVIGILLAHFPHPYESPYEI